MGVNNTINVGGDVIAFASSDKRLKKNTSNGKNVLDKFKDIKPDRIVF